MDEVVDQAGRRIKLRRVGVLETLRLYKALGAALSENTAYINVAVVVASVCEMDGVPVPFPLNEAAVEALIARIGDEAIIKLTAAVKMLPIARILSDAGN